MSHQTRRPVLRAFLYPPRCVPQYRLFTQSRISQAIGNRVTVPKVRQPAQKSARVASKEAASIGMMSNDLGFLDGTYTHSLSRRSTTGTLNRKLCDALRSKQTLPFSPSQGPNETRVASVEATCLRPRRVGSLPPTSTCQIM